MDDFEAPSFSLGLDEEITSSFQGHAALQASNPFKIGSFIETSNVTCQSKADTQNLNRDGDQDDDSDFELLPPSSTPRIMKRLQRKSGHSVLTPSNPQQQVHHGIGIEKIKGAASHNLYNSPSEKKACLPENTKTGKTAGSKTRTLPNFWRGVDGKTAKGTSDSFCSKDRVQSKIKTARQDFNKSMKFGASIPERNLDTSQVGPEFAAKGSIQHKLDCEDGLREGDAGTSCDEKENAGKDFVDFRDDSNLSVGNFAKERMYDQLAIGNAMEKPPLIGNSVDDQRASLLDSSFTSGKNDIVRGLDDDKSTESFTAFPSICSSGNGAPQQGSWKSLDHKKGSLPSPSAAECVLGDGKSISLSQRSPIKQSVECPASAHVDNTNGVTLSQSKTTALQSFWKSLNEKKSSTCESYIGIEEDDIENCSTDDDFEFRTPSTRKLSLCGNKTVRKNFDLSNVAVDCTPPQGFGQWLSNETPAHNNFFMQCSPKRSLVNARGSANSMPQNSVCLFSVDAGASQSFLARDATQSLSAQFCNGSRMRQRSPLDKLPLATSTKNILGPNEDTHIFSDRVEEYDHCKTPIPAFQENVNVSGGKDMSFVGRASLSDPRVANFLRLRFPHFLSLSALRHGDPAGAEHVYIDYENQFSGGKPVSCQSGSTTLIQQTRQRPTTTKWRKSAQKNQKTAMADNDGWIRTGNRNSTSRCKKSQGVARGSQTPNYTDANSSAGPGHWVTERTGKRIYITKDGRKLSGSSAYKQHIKDSGKRVKKTKRRRPRSKKQKLAT